MSFLVGFGGGICLTTLVMFFCLNPPLEADCEAQFPFLTQLTSHWAAYFESRATSRMQFVWYDREFKALGDVVAQEMVRQAAKGTGAKVFAGSAVGVLPFLAQWAFRLRRAA